MTRRDSHAWQPGDVQFVAGLVAYLVFAPSAGVYVGTEGRVRAAALAIGLVTGVELVLLLISHFRISAGPRRGR